MTQYYWHKYTAQANYTTTWTENAWVYQGEVTEPDAYGYLTYSFNSSNGTFATTGSQIYTPGGTSGTYYFGGGSAIFRYVWINSTKYGYSRRDASSSSTFSHYSQGSFIETIIDDEFAHPTNGYDAGYWWVRGNVYNPAPTAPVQIATCKIKTASTILTIPVYDPGLFMDGKNQLRVYLGVEGVGAFMLVDTSDPNASPWRVRLNGVTKAVRKL